MSHIRRFGSNTLSYADRKFQVLCSKIFSISATSLIILLQTNPIPANAAAVNFDSMILNLYTSGGTNYAFRAILVTNPNPTLCPNGFIYINANDDNYQARVATILSAQAQGRRVYGTAYTDGTGNCMIADIGM